MSIWCDYYNAELILASVKGNDFIQFIVLLIFHADKALALNAVSNCYFA